MPSEVGGGSLESAPAMHPVHAIFPGTFDPPTLGHLDVIRRAALLFGRLTIVLADHPSKEPLFTVEERVELLGRCAEGIAGVDVRTWSGLVVDACAEFGGTVIVRGVRNDADFTYEAQMAGTNRALRPDLDTVLLATASAHGHITSTLVRQIARLGGDVSSLVPAPVEAALRNRRGG